MRIHFKRTYVNRAMCFLAGDLALVSTSIYSAFLLRFEYQIPYITEQYDLPLFCALFIATKIPIFLAFRLYSMSWKYVGTYELLDVAKAVTVSGMALSVLIYVINPGHLFRGFPRSIILIDYVLSIALISSFRLSKRLYLHSKNGVSGKGTRTLIIGAGNAGEVIARDMRSQNTGKYKPIGFVDDDPRKKGSFLQGMQVLGGTEDLPDLIDRLDIGSVLIAAPSATGKEMRRIMTAVHMSGVKDVRVIPGIRKIIEGNVTLADVKQISIEDVIGREQISIGIDDIRRLASNKAVLVTGAGGSIGSEIVRQVIRYTPKTVYALDVDETDLFNLEQEIKQSEQSLPLIPIVADICDQRKLAKIFQSCRPDIVLHAAAYKHVPMMELYPEEALKVNVFGTLNVVNETVKAGAGKFVLISTDKAVTPTSIMGATKRVAEELVKFYNTVNHTQFMAVRFGNVVGSRGSVIPLFERQISRGGPITVTHRDMQRYFMSIPEAVALVLQAGAIGEGGEVFILNMGEPVRILDVAREMIRLHGLEPDKDIPIVFTGLRDGEKLTERLVTPLELVEGTSHPKILRAKNDAVKQDIVIKMEHLKNLCIDGDRNRIVAALKDILPTFCPAEESVVAASRKKGLSTDKKKEAYGTAR